MPIGYEKYKTPFYEVSVSDSSGKNFIKLPYHIHKLITKVEILETFTPCTPSQINITFVEGSRESFSHSKTADPNIYPSAGDGLLTNKSGLITDLRFTTDKQGITAASLQDAVSFVSDAKNAAAGAITGLGLTPDEYFENVITQHSSSPNYLLNERNQIQIRWGYLEQPETVRIMKCFIQMIETEFPEAGQPITNVICINPRSALNQVSPVKGKSFYNKIPLIPDPNSGKLTTYFQILNTKEILERIAQDNGIDVIASDDLLADELDSNHAKTLPAGMTVDQFFRNLARRHNAFYNVIIHPKTSKWTVFLISQSDIESQVLSFQKNLFTYKAPGSLIKSIKVRGDYDSSSFYTATGINDKGSNITATSNYGADKTVKPAELQLVDMDPTAGNAISEIKQLKAGSDFSGKMTTKAYVSPEANSPSSLNEQSKAKANCSRTPIYLEFVSLGFTQLLPPFSIEFKGLGERYSGKYRLVSITHTLDESGYICRGTAASGNISGLFGGSGTTKSTEDVTPPAFSTKLFNPLAFNENPATEYLDMMLG